MTTHRTRNGNHGLLKRLACLATVLGLLASAGSSRAADNKRPPASPYGAATVAPFKAAPVVDGRIEPGEWDGTVQTVGFAAALYEAIEVVAMMR